MTPTVLDPMLAVSPVTLPSRCTAAVFVAVYVIGSIQDVRSASGKFPFARPVDRWFNSIYSAQAFARPAAVILTSEPDRLKMVVAIAGFIRTSARARRSEDRALRGWDHRTEFADTAVTIAPRRALGLIKLGGYPQGKRRPPGAKRTRCQTDLPSPKHA